MPTAYDKDGQLRQAGPGDQKCGYCSQIVDDGVEWQLCAEVYHCSCVALDRKPKAVFTCSTCEELEAEEDIMDNGGYQSDGGTDDEGDEDNDDEGEEDEGYEDDDRSSVSSVDSDRNPVSYLTEIDFLQFADKVQLDDKEATPRYLLAFPYEKVYQDDDLNI